MLKDLGFAISAGKVVHVALPLGNVAKELYHLAGLRGFGGKYLVSFIVPSREVIMVSFRRYSIHIIVSRSQEQDGSINILNNISRTSFNCIIVTAYIL
jgi:hypothetical protein